MSVMKNFETEFVDLQEAYRVNELHKYFNEDNWQNCQADLINTLDRIDGDVRQMFYDKCYPTDATDPSGRGMTIYARQLVCARYCIGWIGNLAQGDRLDAEQAQALSFIYAAYWHLGQDFLLGNIVENLLRRIGDPEQKAPALDTSLAKSPTALGIDIWKEIWRTWREGYFTLSSLGRAFATSKPQKPPFRNDFLVKVNQFLESTTKPSPKKKATRKKPAPIKALPKKTLGKRIVPAKKPAAKKARTKKARR